MRTVLLLLSWLFTLLILGLMHLGFGEIPPLGRLLDPVNGLWANAETENQYEMLRISHARVQQPIEIHYNERLVPHIYAENEHDLFFAQGFVTARHRLWQMDFMARFAGGRLSEVLGVDLLPLDRAQRRKGLVYAAEQSQAEFLKNPHSNSVIQAYTDGVNAWIEQLSYRDYPVEFKLLNYRPEPWTPLKTALILKYMSDLLTGNDMDLEMTRVYAALGRMHLMHDFPDVTDSDTTAIVPIQKWPMADFQPDTGQLSPPGNLEKLPARVPHSMEARGSNNWVISAQKSETGAPLLANDPHLPLNLPSIWFEMHLQAPGYDCYGVSIPGTPTLIIGFNNRASWGLTNGSIDVKDWYRVNFRDRKREEYLYDDRWLPVVERVETIYVRGGKTVHDTVRYTLYGPVVYEDSLVAGTRSGLAMRWTGHEAGNELLTFYLLNKMQETTDFEEAISYFASPAQNFIYADVAGNIGIVQQGLIPLRWPLQGKILLEGNETQHHWQGFWPPEWMPRAFNPRRGYLFSTNQHPFDAAYPLYYTGRFDAFRSRRIAELLAYKSSFGIEDMQQFQLDLLNMQARDALPLMLEALVDGEIRDAEIWLDSLNRWDYRYHAESAVPTFFESWFSHCVSRLWPAYGEYGLEFPSEEVSICKLKAVTEDDSVGMELREVVRESFRITLSLFSNPGPDHAWKSEKATRLRHMARIPAFHSPVLNTGGCSNTLNAITSTHGPTWRMVVSLEKSPRGWGIYPGGQSGNPGSHYYLRHVDDWEKGKYYPLERIARDAWRVRPSAGVVHIQPEMP